MNLVEAIKALEEGKRIRQSHYAEGVYLYMGEDGYIRFNDGEKYRGMGGINLSDEWEVCGEVKKDTRVEVPRDLKKVYRAVGEFWDSETYNSYGEYILQTEGENHLLKLWNQLCQMNEHYKLDE